MSQISSVAKTLDCRVGGCGLNSRGLSNTQGVNITEK